MNHLRLFLRGYVIVTLTAFNVNSIAHHLYAQALLGGFGISFIWFGNSKTAAHSDLRFAREVYALGAALGTITGMALAGK